MSDTIHVRRATTADAREIARLMLEVQAVHVEGRPEIFKPGGGERGPEIAARIANADHFYWVAACDGAIVGYAFARRIDEVENQWKYGARTLILDQMGVTREHQRSGVGERLWHAVRELAISERVDRIILNVWAFNTSARDFYVKMGFAPFHERMSVEL